MFSPLKHYVVTTAERYAQSRPPRALTRTLGSTRRPELKFRRGPEAKRGPIVYGGAQLTLVTSSNKVLLAQPERGGSFSLGLHVACGQHPRVIKSKLGLAAFRMSPNQPLGHGATLRRDRRLNFNYKWVFLAPGSGSRKFNRSALGLNNVYVFALDHHDYSTFEHWNGLDLDFHGGRAPAI